MKLFLVLCVVAVAVAMPTENVENAFQEWRAMYGRMYSSKGEYAHHLQSFENNLKLVIAHNAGNHSYTLGMGVFADLTNAEYRATMLMPKGRAGRNYGSHGNFFAPKEATAPDSWDWRSQGAVNPIKDQGQCGSCYTFGANDAMEHAYWRSTKQLLNLAEQQLVDCSQAYGNEGCNGGWQDWCMEYAKAQGMMQTKDYAYIARQGSCRYDANKATHVISSDAQVAQGDENALKEAAYLYELAIAIDASQFSFQLYRNGVYDPASCKNGDDDLDHAVGIVGYGHDDASNKDYWTVRNSWGTGWGQSGYIWMVRNKNNKCGVATHSYYAA